MNKQGGLLMNKQGGLLMNKQGGLLIRWLHGHCRTATTVCSDFCAVAPSPELKERLKAELADAKNRSTSPLAESLAIARGPRRLGFDDGVIIPPDQLPVGTPYAAIRATAAD